MFSGDKESEKFQLIEKILISDLLIMSVRERQEGSEAEIITKH